MENHASYIRSSSLATEYNKRISQNIGWLLPLHTHPAITTKEGGARDDSNDTQSDIELIDLQAYFLPCIHVNVSVKHAADKTATYTCSKPERNGFPAHQTFLNTIQN